MQHSKIAQCSGPFCLQARICCDKDSSLQALAQTLATRGEQLREAAADGLASLLTHLQERCNGAEAVPEIWRELWEVFSLLAELQQRVFARSLVAELVHILLYV
jgi:hypothetical protein